MQEGSDPGVGSSWGGIRDQGAKRKIGERQQRESCLLLRYLLTACCVYCFFPFFTALWVAVSCSRCLLTFEPGTMIISRYCLWCSSHSSSYCCGGGADSGVILVVVIVILPLPVLSPVL